MRKSLSDNIATELRRAILRGSLAPGAPIKERLLAAEMNVSRTPMREAVRILAQEGLVHLRPARSPVVANPAFDEIAGSIEVLRALECLSGELACARASVEEIADIRRQHEEFVALYDRIDTLDLFERDMEFHVAIVRAAHNPVLAETHLSFLARMWRARYLSGRRRRSRDRVIRQHGLIVDGLERRDAAQTTGQIEAHLTALLDNIRQDFEAGHAGDAETHRPEARQRQNKDERETEDT